MVICQIAGVLQISIGGFTPTRKCAYRIVPVKNDPSEWWVLDTCMQLLWLATPERRRRCHSLVHGSTDLDDPTGTMFVCVYSLTDAVRRQAVNSAASFHVPRSMVV